MAKKVTVHPIVSFSRGTMRIQNPDGSQSAKVAYGVALGNEGSFLVNLERLEKKFR